MDGCSELTGTFRSGLKMPPPGYLSTATSLSDKAILTGCGDEEPASGNDSNEGAHRRRARHAYRKARER